MQSLSLGNTFMKCRSAMMAILALVLLAATPAVLAAVADPAAGRNFNHDATGFPLLGGHLGADCATCHVGGTFKGTPKNCDGCHAVGRRVIATPKSNRHIQTSDPCELCHTNTATFLGVKYNHANVTPTSCAQMCHNGLNATGKPASHSTGPKATESCGKCHRIFAWLPAGFDHVGVVPGTCTTCHNGTGATGKPASHTTIGKATYQCDECHNFGGWLPAHYKHNTAAACSSCHNGTVAAGKPAGHFATTLECSSCHTTTTTWLGATGAMPANHIPYNTGTACNTCHVVQGTKVNRNTLHTYSTSQTCAVCHISPNAYTGNGQQTKKNHEGSSGSNCMGCHKASASYTNWSQ